MFTSFSPDVIGLKLSFEESLQLARANNFTGLDLQIKKLYERSQQTSAQEIQHSFQEFALRAGGWSLPFDFGGSDERYQAGLEMLPNYARLAQQLGGHWCFSWIMPFSETLDYAANLEFHIQRLQPISQILANAGCRLGLEFIGPKTLRMGHRYEFIHTLAAGLDLCSRVDSANVGLLLDSFHWYTSHSTLEELANLQAEQIVYVHVNDAYANRTIDEQLDDQRHLPGDSGVIDLVGFLQTLQRINYQGPVVVEPFNKDLQALPAAERVQRTAKSLHTVFAQAGIVEG
ncbi:MAG TPA: sugar phosphate isomerase/epimerase [Ktedonobacteraceae bacterium]